MRIQGNSSDCHTFVNACIWGGIVTYNPDIQRLHENYSAIAPQVERMLVFDNGSRNSDYILDACPGATLIRNDANSGMARALNAMAQKAADAGATDIVFLDQDSVVSGGFVLAMTPHRKTDVGIVCPLIVDRNIITPNPKNDVQFEVKRTVTSGSLVNLLAWQQVGGYDERLFVDCVDNEFCDNLRFNGYRIVRAHDAVLLHEMGHQEYAWGIGGIGKKNVQRAFYRRNYPPWRWADTGRAQAIMIHKYAKTEIGREERKVCLKLLGRILLIEKNRLKNLKAYVRGYREGCKVVHDVAQA